MLLKTLPVRGAALRQEDVHREAAIHVTQKYRIKSI